MNGFIWGFIVGFIVAGAGAWFLRRRGLGLVGSGADDSGSGGGGAVPAELADSVRQDQERKENILAQVMAYAREHGGVSNDEVQKATGVSDATATRYLEELELRGKLKQEGNTGRGVRYEVI
ncbi:MAG: FaeA/PapI family transcriptional regulator [Candidatus Andersenbacteria bacterium]|nr:FaeA/PapI family transcriptional regulator [bacterium]MDZ4225356.1 FaeA/PapI family transcriptional regulator [Candidatus Andersenbacteria bacterium]